MLDIMMYDDVPSSGTDVSPLGPAIFDYVLTSEDPMAVRQRCVRVGELLGNNFHPPNRVLSVACGHSRKLDFISHSNSPENLFALDQDAESLVEVKQRSTGYNVTPLPLSIKELVPGKRLGDLKDFDLIYSAGL